VSGGVASAPPVCVSKLGCHRCRRRRSRTPLGFHPWTFGMFARRCAGRKTWMEIRTIQKV